MIWEQVYVIGFLFFYLFFLKVNMVKGQQDGTLNM